MEVDFEEGVEVVINLRYEKLFGFCRNCSSMTHDQSRCPSLLEEEVSITEVSNSEQGDFATSYRAVVTNGKVMGEAIRVGNQVAPRGMIERAKGKGIMRERHGGFRQDGVHRSYKDKFSRGFGEGSSRGGRQYGYGAPRGMNGRFVINSKGTQNLQIAKEGTHLSNPQKLMLGAQQVPKSQEIMVGDGSHSKARKYLKFDEEVRAEDLDSKRFESLVEDNIRRKEARQNASDIVEQDMNSALDDANLMVEGELLSDSELLSEECEEGEVCDLMDEAELETEDNVAKVAKKKVMKPRAFGGATKKRIVQSILSPRKNKFPKGPGKNGSKGNGEGKKTIPKLKRLQSKEGDDCVIWCFVLFQFLNNDGF
ncbi:unnamed protein product [Eruca vesicaria subsp. sativa]|uniref:Zinc knuckle CX2CX4HX4C domain-containing protein n=1 Tax=Eruca vesicaria subsp. sativa TaxID=29727 RepID=A0ABC8K7R2_ERUVS|nr:unnamed protein product [Eruca vesicaria subsp. sativa]